MVKRRDISNFEMSLSEKMTVPQLRDSLYDYDKKLYEAQTRSPDLRKNFPTS